MGKQPLSDSEQAWMCFKPPVTRKEELGLIITILPPLANSVVLLHLCESAEVITLSVNCQRDSIAKFLKKNLTSVLFSFNRAITKGILTQDWGTLWPTRCYCITICIIPCWLGLLVIRVQQHWEGYGSLPPIYCQPGIWASPHLFPRCGVMASQVYFWSFSTGHKVWQLNSSPEYGNY